MLALFETPAGYAIFKLLDEKKLSQTENLYSDFKTPEAASKVVKLKHFEKFQDTTEALAATTATVEGKLSKMLKKVIKKHVANEDVQSQLLIADAKLGMAIKEKFELSCISNSAVQELMRCIRYQLEGLLAGLPKKDMTAMALGLAHSLSRYKLKFSPDKVDTMIVQAVCLLDDLDKELNNYIMRCREWYGWHFPELGKIVTDNIAFVNTVKLIGTRENTSSTDLSDILPEDVEERVKEAAEISMGTEISEDDIQNVLQLCDQILEMSTYRTQLFNYLSARMMAMAPNLTTLVGELVGARLISKSGSLINLAKAPASTLQILGAEKALFRALKTKKDTPKYGLIYHSALVTAASTKNKGKVSRMLSTKAALCARLDAMGEDNNFDLGAEHKVKLEAKLRLLEEGNLRRLSGTGKTKAKFEKYHGKSEIHQYPIAADSTIPVKRKYSETEDKKPLIEEISPETSHKKKKIKIEPGYESPEIKKEEDDEGEQTSSKKKKKKKKMKQELVEEEEAAAAAAAVDPELTESGKKKKKKRKHSEGQEAEEVAPTPEMKRKHSEEKEAEGVTPTPEKKKKKKKKSVSDE